jgi:hypothetical protein
MNLELTDLPISLYSNITTIVGLPQEYTAKACVIARSNHILLISGRRDSERNGRNHFHASGSILRISSNSLVLTPVTLMLLIIQALPHSIIWWSLFDSGGKKVYHRNRRNCCSQSSAAE